MTGVVLGLFFAFQIALGIFASRKNSSLEQYFLAGRRLRLPLVAMSLFATWFGAETCLGAAGAVYERGISGGRAEPFGYALCLVLAGLLLAPRLATGRYLTLGDLYREAFGIGAERLVVCLLVPSGLVWGASQVRAFGQVLAEVSGLSVSAAICVAAVVAVVYTGFGGLLGDVLTDLFQGAILTFGLGALLVGVAYAWPSSTDLSSVLTPERLSPFPKGESTWIQLDRFALPVLGSLITQEVVTRLLAAESARTAQRGAYLAAVLYLIVALIPVVLGLMGPALVPGLKDPEALLPALARTSLSPLFYAIFHASLLAAILSTVDSILLSAAALTTHNLMGSVFGKRTEGQEVAWSRAAVAGAGLVCMAVALSARGVYELVEFASGLGTAGLVVTTGAALYDPRPSGSGAVAALWAGLVAPPALGAVGVSAPFLGGIGSAVFAYTAFRVGSGLRREVRV